MVDSSACLPQLACHLLSKPSRAVWKRHAHQLTPTPCFHVLTCLLRRHARQPLLGSAATSATLLWNLGQKKMKFKDVPLWNLDLLQWCEQLGILLGILATKCMIFSRRSLCPFKKNCLPSRLKLLMCRRFLIRQQAKQVYYACVLYFFFQNPRKIGFDRCVRLVGWCVHLTVFFCWFWCERRHERVLNPFWDWRVQQRSNARCALGGGGGGQCSIGVWNEVLRCKSWNGHAWCPTTCLYTVAVVGGPRYPSSLPNSARYPIEGRSSKCEGGLQWRDWAVFGKRGRILGPPTTVSQIYSISGKVVQYEIIFKWFNKENFCLQFASSTIELLFFVSHHSLAAVKSCNLNHNLMETVNWVSND